MNEIEDEEEVLREIEKSDLKFLASHWQERESIEMENYQKFISIGITSLVGGITALAYLNPKNSLQVFAKLAILILTLSLSILFIKEGLKARKGAYEKQEIGKKYFQSLFDKIIEKKRK